MAENGEVGDKVLHWNFKVSPMYSGFLLVEEKTYHQGDTQTGMEEADRQLGLPRVD